MQEYINNEIIVKRLLEGRADALNSAYNLYFRKMHIFAKSYIKDGLVAEDIVQDAFLTLWEKRESIKPDTQIGAFLLTIVRNKALNFIKHQQTRLAVEQNLQTSLLKDLALSTTTLEACDPDYIFSNEVEAIIKASIDQLPEQSRRVMLLSRFENKSNSEIAEILGITVKGVEFHITKSLKVLRTNLKDYLPSLFFLLY